jgi:hypothetical protein
MCAGVRDVEVFGDLFHNTESEHVVLDGCGFIDAPLVAGVGLGQLAFGGADGREGVDDLLRELIEFFDFFLGHDEDLRGEAVFEGVEAAALFAGFGFGAGGFLRVGAIGF